MDKLAGQEKSKRTARLFWTGGWDSTFRMLTLAAFEGATVIPYYIYDERRVSTPYELKAMDEIREEIYRRFPNSNARIKPTVFFERADIEPNGVLAERHENLCKIQRIGDQYRWLAEFALMNDLSGLEVSIVRGHLYDKLVKHCDRIDDPVIGRYYKISRDKCEDDSPYLLYERFHFPVLDYTKTDMEEICRKNGTFDILNKSWFCFTPIGGKPCGLCNPCHWAATEGMEFRLTRAALLRHRYKKLYFFGRRVKRRLKLMVTGKE